MQTPNVREQRPDVMLAIVQQGYGARDALALAEIARPVPEDDEVLVRVRAASVNHADWAITTGDPYLVRLASGLRTPRSSIRGQDVAGQVEAAGKDVTRFRAGDEVYGEIDGGGFAEYVCVPAAALFRKPAAITFEEAAAVPLAGNTALIGLRDVGRLQAGQKVLVNGASGGVGTFAVQIAKALGAEVTGVCSTRNVDMVRSIGADYVIDYAREDFVALGRRFDLILDLAGSRPLSEYRRALTPTGTLVLSSGRGGRVFGPMGRILVALASSPLLRHDMRVHALTRKAADVSWLYDLVEAGVVRPLVERTYPLREAARAIRHFGQEHARTKIVITP